MTIKQLLDGVKVSWIHVNVVEQLSPTHFIVGDGTGLAIMEIDPNHVMHVEVGQGKIREVWLRYLMSNLKNIYLLK